MVTHDVCCRKRKEKTDEEADIVKKAKTEFNKAWGCVCVCLRVCVSVCVADYILVVSIICTM